MIVIFLLIDVFCKSLLQKPIIDSEDNKFSCTISFDKTLQVQGYKILRGRVGHLEDGYSEIYMEGSTELKSMNSIEVDLTGRCLLDDSFLYLVAVEIETMGNIWYSDSFIYDTKANKFVLSSDFDKYVQDKHIFISSEILDDTESTSFN